MKLLLTMVVLLAVLGTSMAIELSGSAGKAILANITGNKPLNTSNETQSGLAGWGTSHDLTTGNNSQDELGTNSTSDESAMETPTQAADQ